MNLIELHHAIEIKAVDTYLRIVGFEYKKDKENIFKLAKGGYSFRQYVEENGKVTIWISADFHRDTMLRVNKYPISLYGYDSLEFLMNHTESPTDEVHYFCFFIFKKQNDFIYFLRLLYRHDRELFRIQHE